MLTIRLARRGKRKQPTYRLIVSEKARSTKGRFLELLGSYNPLMNPPQVRLDAERIKHWLSVGAQTSATVHNLLLREKVIEGKTRPKGKNAKAQDAAPNAAAEASTAEKPSG